MDSLHFIMPEHQKEKHLSFEQRVIIQTRLKDGCSIRAIAREVVLLAFYNQLRS